MSDFSFSPPKLAKETIKYSHIIVTDKGVKVSEFTLKLLGSPTRLRFFYDSKENLIQLRPIESFSKGFKAGYTRAGFRHFSALIRNVMPKGEYVPLDTNTFQYSPPYK